MSINVPFLGMWWRGDPVMMVPFRRSGLAKAPRPAPGIVEYPYVM
jgi:hypothetical protein